MNEEKRLPSTAHWFLCIVGGIADFTKIALEFFFGIGIVLDPILISPIAGIIFGMTFVHNGVPMLSGKRAWMGWTAVIIGLTPVIDALPNWTTLAYFS